MKKFPVILAAVATILLVFIILFTSLQVVMGNESFINNAYTELDIARNMGMSNVDLVRAYQRLVDYMEGQVSTISIQVTINDEPAEMFALDQEREHMKDVRLLFQTVRQYRDLAILGCLILLLAAVLLGFKNAPATLSRGYLYGFFICALFFGFFGTWALLDFSSFWTMFHESLFWNDMWLFDPSESRMINMLPQSIFADIISTTVLYMGIVLAVLLAASVFCLIRLKHNKERMRAEKERRRLIRERKAAGLPIEDELLTPAQRKARKQKQREEAKRAEEIKKKQLARQKAKEKAEKDAQREKEKQLLLAALNKKRKQAIESVTKKTGLAISSGPLAARDKNEADDADDFVSTGKEKSAKKAAKAAMAGASKGNAKKAKAEKRKRREAFELVLPDETDYFENDSDSDDEKL